MIYYFKFIKNTLPISVLIAEKNIIKLFLFMVKISIEDKLLWHYDILSRSIRNKKLTIVIKIVDNDKHSAQTCSASNFIEY